MLQPKLLIFGDWTKEKNDHSQEEQNLLNSRYSSGLSSLFS